jgi:predicted MFS family arabinose efflux permease
VIGQHALFPLHHESVRRFSLFFALVYFAQGFADLAAGLANLPIQYLLKERLGLSAAESGVFWAVVGFGWTMKPLYGFVSDLFPLVGYHRKSYLVIMAALGVAGWLTLAVAPPHYILVLTVCALCAATLAFCDVMTDALMVETGRPVGLTGSFQAIQWAAMSLALVLAQFGGGYLATHATPQTVFLIAAAFPLLTLLATVGFVQEPRVRTNYKRQQDTLVALQEAIRSRTLWLVVIFLALWNFSPSLGTPLLYYLTDVLGFSKVFIGTLGALSNVGGILGALWFFVYLRAVSLSRLLYISVALGVVSTLCFVGLIGPKSAVVLFAVSGIFTQITHLAVLDLAARSCPARAEGTVFALLMSTLNISKSGGNVLGGWLYDHTGLVPLIVVSAAFTALCGCLVPLLEEKRSDVH